MPGLVSSLGTARRGYEFLRKMSWKDALIQGRADLREDEGRGLRGSAVLSCQGEGGDDLDVSTSLQAS